MSIYLYNDKKINGSYLIIAKIFYPRNLTELNSIKTFQELIYYIKNILKSFSS